MGKVRSRRNKPAKRATGISRRFLSPASRACSPLLCHPQLALWASELPPAPRAPPRTARWPPAFGRRPPVFGC
jgi:hypothetical protein